MTIKALYPTVRPTLNLDFAKTKVLDPRITFTRASTATFIGVDGLIQTAVTGVPRFDHNPTTVESLGLLVEEARTNLLLNSATLSTQSATVTATSTTLSFYGTGTVTLTGVSTAGPLVGTGASNRVSLTFTPTAGSLTLTVSGSVTNAQLETGAFPTSYIPTTGATVTRAADVASMTGTNFSSWYNQDQGTLVATTPSGIVTTATANQSYFGVSTSTLSSAIGTGNGFKYGNGSPSTNTRLFVIAASATQLDNNSATNASKIAFAYATNNFALARGQSLSTDTSGDVPAGMDTFTIRGVGSQSYSRLAYYPVRLPDAQLQALTAT